IGPHGTVRPKTFFMEELDFILRGEPELAAAELLKSIEDGGHYPDGVVFNGKWEWNSYGKISIISDLNKLPRLRFDNLDYEQYPYPVPPSNIKNCKTILYEASRGCMYKCIFCWRTGFRDKYRQKNIDRIYEELLDLKERQIKYVYFIDEVFPVNNEWSLKVGSILKELELQWGCQTRPEFILKDDVVKMMISSGCRHVQIGLETTDPESYRISKKSSGNIDLAVLNSSIRRMLSNRIAVDLFLVCGLPGETGKSLLNAVKNIRNFPLDKIKIIAHKALPFPGTELWDMGVREGKPLNTWSDIDRFSGLIGNTYRNKYHLQKIIDRVLAYLNIFKTVKRIKSNLRNSYRLQITDIIKICYYAGCYFFPVIKNIKMRLINRT
ncbi:MAG: radical SAM protein, partial [bacterium]